MKGDMGGIREQFQSSNHLESGPRHGAMVTSTQHPALGVLTVPGC